MNKKNNRHALPYNLVLLSGELNRAPQLKTLLNGRTLAAFDVKSPGPVGPSNVVNVTWFDAPVAALRAEKGTSVMVIGQVRRYWFAGRQSVTDVVAHRVLVRPTDQKVQAVIEVVLSELRSAWCEGAAA